jgi:plastocyanin
MKKIVALLALALASLALVACGGGSSSSSSSSGEEANGGGAAESEAKSAGGGSGGGGESTVDLEADPNGELAYTSTEASAKAGKVTVDFNNPQGLTHDVAIENESGETVGKTELIADSQTSTTVNLKPGTYHYYCTVPGHREAGMEGTLTVR